MNFLKILLSTNLLKRSMLLIICLSVTISSCKKNEEKPEDVLSEESIEESKEEDIEPKLELGCYVFKDANNLIQLKITKLDNPIEGNMMVALADEEKIVGEFIGEFKERILFGTYKFQTEGRQNTKDIIYMLKGNQLLEGKGGRNKSGTKYNEAQKVTYENNMPLTKTKCL